MNLVYTQTPRGYIYSYMHKLNAYMHKSIDTLICIYVYNHVHTHTRMYACKQKVHTYITCVPYIHLHTHIYTYRHTDITTHCMHILQQTYHIQTYSNTHTYHLSLSLSLSPVYIYTYVIICNMCIYIYADCNVNRHHCPYLQYILVSYTD